MRRLRSNARVGSGAGLYTEFHGRTSGKEYSAVFMFVGTVTNTHSAVRQFRMPFTDSDNDVLIIENFLPQFLQSLIFRTPIVFVLLTPLLTVFAESHQYGQLNSLPLVIDITSRDMEEA